MKRLKTIANDLLELAENVEEWDKYLEKIKNPEEDEKLQAIINDRNELISKLFLLDQQTRFQYSERPAKAQAKWFNENWGISESTLDFYRNRKSKSIAKQYNDLDNKPEIGYDKEDIKTNDIVNTDMPEQTNNVINDKSQEEATTEVVSVKSGYEKKLKTMNKRDIEDTIWSKVTPEQLCLLEPQQHTPYQYGDIMENGKVYVWKNRYVDKETFYKSYTMSKKFIEKKNALGLSIGDIIQKTGLPRHIVNNAMYYPHIKIEGMLLEQFERKYDEI